MHFPGGLECSVASWGACGGAIPKVDDVLSWAQLAHNDGEMPIEAMCLVGLVRPPWPLRSTAAGPCLAGGSAEACVSSVDQVRGTHAWQDQAQVYRNVLQSVNAFTCSQATKTDFFVKKKKLKKWKHLGTPIASEAVQNRQNEHNELGNYLFWNV